MPAAITLDNVSKRFRIFHEKNQSIKAIILKGRVSQYEEFWAVKNATLEVEAGESFAFIGHNGSGKSTTLKLIAKILEPETGKITVRGKTSALLELGAGFHPELSGRENVFLNGTLLGLSQRDLKDRFDDIVGFAGLEQFIDMAVKNYSSGMMARLGFSVAINVDPEVLLIDEVLAVGDEQFQRRCLEKINGFRNDGRTVVIVSHGLGVLRTLCDRIAWIDHGQIKMVDKSSDVIDAYLASVSNPTPTSSNDVQESGRWGSGEVQVDRIDVMPASAHRESRPCTGDEVTFRIHYNSHERLVTPVFAMAIYRNDGIEITRTTSQAGGVVINELLGEGTCDVVVSRIGLLPGEYHIEVSLTDETGTHMYDHRPSVTRFEVLPEPGSGVGGIVTMFASWSAPKPN